ncbi:threonine dehydrogenase-like Zn-dependent dehydrogenase [Rhizomicrobium palustre]|uniref:Threonine dehydrogenase-like Zn-dependent dehydrogenase n=1 Tax=Rhizomicrobium palustre TaxID=189966 RepID=A0A846MVV7_9PROT|nr:zinc-dependent alcohol dehydrogenase [Rhizomicrobium palustre]NIK87180.1 threonine dehydrogenase-like Zn-dependent dehydrogenase [Rhizomicrobium palustre]
MRALVWHGRNDVRCDTVPDPIIEEPRDAIVKVTSTAICGSDLHLYDGYIPAMMSGDILGHEFMGEVVEVGSGNSKLKVGDRVIVPFTICCGECFFCQKGLWSCCERTNRDSDKAAEMFGHQCGGLFGYSHLTGHYPGGQAEYVRVPFADVAPTKVPEGFTDEQLLFLTDILPTGYQGATYAQIEPGETVAIWGAGPVGQMALRSAQMLGAGHVVVIDRVPERLTMAAAAGAEAINFEQEDVYDRLNAITKGRGPDRVIEAVGMEAHGTGSWDAFGDRALAATGLGTDRIHALRDCIRNVRAGGTVSVSGVFGGYLNGFPFGAAVQKGLTIKAGQCNVLNYLPTLIRAIQEGKIDPSFVITHRCGLEDGPEMYKTFRDKKDGCIKVVMRPHG